LLALGGAEHPVRQFSRSEPPPTYAFAKLAIPRGSDACWDTDPLADPQILDLTNDGSLAAFNSRDMEHQGPLAKLHDGGGLAAPPVVLRRDDKRPHA
jgi:hypothetical protein